jgi:hypothetical protein
MVSTIVTITLMEMLQSRTLVSPADFELAIMRCESFGMHTLRVYGPLDEPAGVVFALGGGGALELSRQPGHPPCGVRLWIHVPSLPDALDGLVSREYPGQIGPVEHQPWGLIECTVELFDGVAVVLVEIPRDHPLRWRS